MSTSGDVESTSNSPTNPSSLRPAVGSPRTKVKFLCSYAGKILPRPADAHLKYVGGETRVISVPRNITFTGLMKKLSSLIDGDVTLKYQLIPEELDALVTVKSDEDLHHMLEEYDRHDVTGTPRLRTFLFPASPIIIDNQIGPIDRHSLEQRYINSVNGIIFNPTPIHNNSFRPPAVNTGHTSFTISSTCSSPRTPPETATPTGASPTITNPEIMGFRKQLGGTMTRARSSPNLCDLNHKNPTPMSTLNLGLNNLNNQQYPYNHQHYQYHRQPQPPPPPPPLHHHPQLFPKPPLDPSPHKHSPHSGSDHFTRMRSSTGMPDYYRHPADNNQHTSSPYARSSRSGGGHMVYQRGSPYDEYYANNRYDRVSPPGSPLARSPLHNNYATRWDSVGGR